MRFAIASAAVAGAAGALLVGNHLETSPPTSQSMPVAESTPYKSYRERVIKIKNTIQQLHDRGANGVWIEDIIEKGTRTNTELTRYTVAYQTKSHKVYDQLILFVKKGEIAPDRLMIVMGASEQKYRPGNDHISGWLEISKAGTSKDAPYFADGTISSQPVNTTNTIQNLTEVVLDGAELILGLPPTNSDDPRLVA